MSGLLPLGTGAWLVIAAILWLAGGRDNRARTWLLVHAAIPLPVLALTWWGGASGLTAALQTFLVVGAVVWGFLSVAWVVGSFTRNHSHMDIAYPLSGLAAATAAYWWNGLGAGRNGVLLAMVLVWALRLLSHTVRTNLHIEQEPYRAWRSKFGQRWWWWSYFQVYMLQGVMVWVWGISFAFAMTLPGNLSPLDLAGMAVWSFGLMFQAVGDRQLKNFKANPDNRGKVMQSGLWSLTRHPNYFGEAVMWTGYFLFALAHPWGTVAIVSPLYVAWFMSVGSAAKGNERHMRKTKPDYAAYQQRVPMFFPWLSPRG